jgi:hypothetical protein
MAVLVVFHPPSSSSTGACEADDDDAGADVTPVREPLPGGAPPRLGDSGSPYRMTQRCDDRRAAVEVEPWTTTDARWFQNCENNRRSIIDDGGHGQRETAVARLNV